MPVGDRAGNDVDVDLRQLFSSVARNWTRILLWALAITAIAFIFAWTATPKFRSQAKVMITIGESVFTRPQQETTQDSTSLDDLAINSQIQRVMSNDVLKRVVDQLKDDLAKAPEFDKAANPGMLSNLLAMLKISPDVPADLADERLIEALRERLTVYQLDKSRVIAIEAVSSDRALAKKIVDSVSDNYLSIIRQDQLQDNQDATAFLEPQIKELTQHVKEAEDKVAAFRASNDLLTGRDQSTLVNQQLSDLSTELSRVRASRANADATADAVRAALRNGSSMDSLPKVLESPMIQRLRERQVQIRSDIADLSTTLLPGHPRIRALRSQLTDIDSQIRIEAQNVLKSLSTDAATARARETELTAEMNRLKVTAGEAGEQEVQLRALERDAAAKRDTLENYLASYRQLSSRDSQKYVPVDAKKMSDGNLPTAPYFPKIGPIVGAAFVGSLLLMMIITLMREIFSGNAMRYAGTVAEEEPQPALQPLVTPAVMPQMDMAAQEPLAPIAPVEDVLSPAGHRGLEVAEAVSLLIATNARRAIVCSPEGDDAAATSVLLAREAADRGLRALLIDLTASGAASGPMLERTVAAGITNLLCAQAQFSDVIHSDHFSEAHIIPVGTADAVKAMRAADRLPIILESLTSVYDLIVVECGVAPAKSLKRLLSEGSRVVVSALDLNGVAVADTIEELNLAGYADVITVTPVDASQPTPIPGRTAA